MTGLDSLPRLLNVESRSISAENPSGERGGGGKATEGTGAIASRDLGRGWKVSPSIVIPPGDTAVLADINGCGMIRHIWITSAADRWRDFILRMSWDGSPEPAVEVPLGDFFCNGWKSFSQVDSVPIAANPNGGFNSYWPMPFRSGAVITIENRAEVEGKCYFQIDYTLGDEQEDSFGYFHAQWRRSNPLPYMATHELLELPAGSGHGHYVGTYIAWGVNNSGWWGEGEVKMYLDGDDEFPTICGTGTEDYFGGAWNFDLPGKGYTPFTTPYLGLNQVTPTDGLYASQQRFGMYRWHIPDPVVFRDSLRVDIQALGWRSGHRYLPLQDDIASTVFFYLDSASARRPELASSDHLEVI